jgi:hypothetical protein
MWKDRVKADPRELLWQFARPLQVPQDLQNHMSWQGQPLQEANDVHFVGDGVDKSTKLRLVALGDVNTASKVCE